MVWLKEFLLMRKTVLSAATVLALASMAFADAKLPEPLDLSDNPTTATSDSGNRYGLFNGLDHRSIYGQFWFPEPLNSDEADVDNEVRLDYQHTEKSGHQFDGLHTELEHAFGLFTVEAGVGWESDRSSGGFDAITGTTDRDTEEGWTNIELAGRYPLYEYVSPTGYFDDTFVFGCEFSPPTHTEISHDTEIVPKLFNLMKIGDHISLQTAVGLSMLVGPDEDGGLGTVEYDAVLGYELTHDALPIPRILNITPIIEFDGEYTLNHDDAQENNLVGVVGARFNFDSVSFLSSQPRVGLGYMFPLDANAREDFHWGIITSLVFEY